MNETLLFLVYALSGAVAFAGVFRGRWRIWQAILAGGLITTIGWLLIFRFTEEEKRPDWIRLDLSLNVTLGLFFAAGGAAIGWRLLRRRASSE